MFNEEGECGSGAVVPWADRLWVVTYAPHKPKGSTDKLYEIMPDLRQIIRPESIGGTPANRMIHRESNQLFIGPYAIGADRTVRAIPYANMFGRPTGNARHLTDPAGKIYYATMEEGIYEVDVKTLAVTKLWADEADKEGRHADLPGYHGKGLYSGQGRLIYANNGDHAQKALTDPTIESGVLAEWDGQADHWTVVRRNQFTEVTGPNGIYGAEHPETEQIWTIGWDYRSLILQVREAGQWHAYRLPKGSHSYDGAHGWNTEWPRIREIGDGPMLMTMHGTFWNFPRTFSSTNSAGISPRSNFLKVTGDFTRWGDRVVIGCDDTAKSEFLNKRGVKGALAGPGQSQSNLWFVKPEQLDHLGPAIGTGAVWERDAVKAGVPSDPFLFSGYDERGLHLFTGEKAPVTVTLETDDGTGKWTKLREVQVDGYAWVEFKESEKAAWIRLTSSRDLAKATATFAYSNRDQRPPHIAKSFTSLARIAAPDYSAGVLLTRGENLRTLSFGATVVKDGKKVEDGYYELDAEMKLHARHDDKALEFVKTKAAVPVGVITSDAASLLVIDDKKHRWRLPKTDAEFEKEVPQPRRVCREVSTERDLLQAEGTFFELPAENAGGFAKMRALSTHLLNISDYCSYRGMLILSGVTAGSGENEHVIQSDDGKVALWAGAIDDLWQLGKPRGHGGPWKETMVKAGEVSDPYLMRGYDKKSLHLEADGASAVTLTVEVDITGEGQWAVYKSISVPPKAGVDVPFPAGFQAYWLRVKADQECVATAQLTYE